MRRSGRLCASWLSWRLARRLLRPLRTARTALARGRRREQSCQGSRGFNRSRPPPPGPGRRRRACTAGTSARRRRAHTGRAGCRTRSARRWARHVQQRRSDHTGCRAEPSPSTSGCPSWNPILNIESHFQFQSGTCHATNGVVKRKRSGSVRDVRGGPRWSTRPSSARSRPKRRRCARSARSLGSPAPCLDGAGGPPTERWPAAGVSANSLDNAYPTSP